MKLIMYSIICGVLGLLFGGAIGGQADNFAIGLFGVIGFLSPALYVLDQIYKSNKSSNEIDFDLTSTLDTLKENDILNDNEYIKSLNYFNLVDKRNENKKKFDECGKILFDLSHENNMVGYEYKIKLLKRLYKQ
ncbi:hypothetical protein LL037_13375 [Clostridium estertheticum]|uniref:hypothetical protein n=1 Tax=Clostridium estertheticum TaxID=238834 RepID=UPI001C0C61B5|nr:hypothetical protein [Clostridium estertheticum]MBU3201467.1 hypothetical protein [Clostridium estertheticum]WAG63480.1 hypothetical protein LL037_13375 [Clostridium estertheticum]